jgi:hypothetical protein
MIVNDHEMFDYVKSQELHALNKPKDASLTGIAFSGGGIRSATFSLGVIQSLAERKHLRKFDYLSTVSGGGYIGSWLSAFINRKAKGDVELAEEMLDPSAGEEDAAITYLRDYSNYLTPKKSLFSNDSLAALATYCRNLLLNQTLLISALAFLLLMPYLAAHGGDWLNHNLPNLCAYFLILALLLISVIFIARHLLHTQRAAAMQTANSFATSQDKSCHCWADTSGIWAAAVLPLLLAAWLLSIKFEELMTPGLFIFGLLAGLTYTLLWSLAWLITKYAGNRFCSLQCKSWRDFAHMLAWTFTPGFLGGVLLFIIVKWLANWGAGAEQWLWLTSWLGMPIVILIFEITAVYHIGLMGRLFTEEQREWWSRLGGMLTLAVSAWLGLFAISIYGPALLIWIYHEETVWFASGGLAWVITSVGGVIAGHSSATRAQASNTTGLTETKTQAALEILAKAAPYIFIIGLLGLVSLGLQCLLAFLEDVHPISSSVLPLSEIVAQQISVLSNFQLDNLLEISAVFLLVALALAYRININLFSLHQFYRYRLTRAYLGASHENRNPNPFTGFDPQDDLALKDLAEQRPYHLINTALNFTSGGRLAWQDRKAASFVFTPKFCGYTLPSLPGEDFYLPTGEFALRRHCQEGVQLGKALAISGAAVSPNMGYHSAPATAFILTFFNVRLGNWISNPRAGLKVWRRSEPAFGLFYLLRELFGFTDMHSRYVYLSDGGHFEKTGVYELIRRECQTIVFCDNGADRNYQFQDLANLIRKCYTDFGVKIEIDVSLLSAPGPDNNPITAFATGDIFYPDGKKGALILLKPSLWLPELPADLLSFSKTNPDFPHHTTLDQWFDEAEFESYRKLGYLVAEAAHKAGCFSKLS